MRFKLVYIVFAVVFFACNSTEKRTDTTATTDTVKATGPGNDQPAETKQPGTNEPTTPVTDTVPKNDPPQSAADKALLGRHNLTLQWIGWNVPGLAVIEKGKDDWYSIKGRQENNKGYLLIDGKIKPASGKAEAPILELEFDGLIEYKEETVNAGQPCSKRGKQKFLSTQGRKYWRLQNMANCDGSTTDYVDIYF